ncbi:hypothetical protein N7495_005278 [Penicillium taxi]|uniref:uncharacterized protein n=1 Tax=Penicillium taxi TaxID=168475 RepID=UPI002544EBE4|nr:uncharacterized protein N7495_005278 [Penicillium taxi]KAJ5893587.1 hypothetical protein N7495_005278 [Penicillium taxi]
MPSPKTDQRTQVDSDGLVPFDHVAAGHDGVRCTLSGALIAKPCTKQEVDFYESSALHPAFQEFIPLFIGCLSSADQQQPAAVAAAQESGALFLPTPSDAPTAPARAIAAESVSQPTPRDMGPSKGLEKPWVPSGGKKLETGLSIVLENVACGFRRPNVLDVKLGARLWADDAPPAKRNKLDIVSKETTSSTLGYRIAGMKVWMGENGETEGGRTAPIYEGSECVKGKIIEKDGYHRYDKWYGRSFNDRNVKHGFETFLAGAKAGKMDRSKLVAQRLVEELRNVQQVLESEESRMYSSSVLVIYEGDPEAMEYALEEEKKVPESKDDEEEDDNEEVNFEFTEEPMELLDFPFADGMPQQAINITVDPSTVKIPFLDNEEDEEETPKVHDLRIIDFAHAKWTPGEGPDENMLQGIRSLINMFEELAE